MDLGALVAAGTARVILRLKLKIFRHTCPGTISKSAETPTNYNASALFEMVPRHVRLKIFNFKRSITLAYQTELLQPAYVIFENSLLALYSS